MRAFKHMERRFAMRAATLGSFLIRPLADFRSIETAGPGIRDEMEGTVALNIRDARFVGGSEDAQRLESSFRLKIAEGGRVTFLNSTVSRRIGDIYLLCLTSDPARPSTIYPGYDTTIEVLSVEGLARALTKAHPDRLGEWRVGAVRYERRVFELGEPMPLDTDPFVKEPRPEFVRQREVRICWAARDECDSSLVTLATDATGFVRVRET